MTFDLWSKTDLQLHIIRAAFTSVGFWLPNAFHSRVRGRHRTDRRTDRHTHEMQCVMQPR